MFSEEARRVTRVRIRRGAGHSQNASPAGLLRPRRDSREELRKFQVSVLGTLRAAPARCREYQREHTQVFMRALIQPPMSVNNPGANSEDNKLILGNNAPWLNYKLNSSYYQKYCNIWHPCFSFFPVFRHTSRISKVLKRTQGSLVLSDIFW